MKLFRSIKDLLTTSVKDDRPPATHSSQKRDDLDPLTLTVSPVHASSGNNAMSRSFDRPRTETKPVGGSMRMAVSPLEVSPTAHSRSPSGPLGSRHSTPLPTDNRLLHYAASRSPAHSPAFSRSSEQPVSPSSRPPLSPRLVMQQQHHAPCSPTSSFRSSVDTGGHGTPSHAAQAQQQQHQHYPAAAALTNPRGASRDSPRSTQYSQSINVSADYAQVESDDDAEGESSVPSGSVHPNAAAVGRHRHSTGSYNLQHKIHRTESLKALLHLDQYNFFSDVDIQEAQLQVDPVLLESLLATDDHNLASEATSRSNILAVSPALPHVMRRVRWSLRDYVLLRQLHKGYASDVFQAQCKLSGEMVALKVYKLGEQCDLQRVQLYREIRVHSQLQHTNVVQFYAGFLEEERVVLIQEFAGGGDLLKFMAKSGGILSERQAVNLVLQPFLAALHYLHTQGIVHRDIKPENVLLTDQLELKLADFGLALDLNEERANTRAGTLDYMAPEVLRCPTKNTPDEGKLSAGAAHYQLGADAWAVGVFAYELITGIRPFKAKQNIDIARNIIHAQVVFPDNMSELSKDFISKALKKHPGDRPTVIEMLNHSWISMFKRRSSVAYASVRSNSIMEMMARKPADVHRNMQADPAAAHGGAAAGRVGGPSGGPTTGGWVGGGSVSGGGARRIIGNSDVLPRSKMGKDVSAQFL